MATNMKLRTPVIKPRTQGGTFYTFGSAMEDIGLNINGTANKVELSHYVLLDIPQFGQNKGALSLPVRSTYSSQGNPGDYEFAEFFQDAVLNMETVLRNNGNYNFASAKTVSERVFWKFLFKDKTMSDFTKDGNYYYENPETSYAKAFGRIVSGSQRIDSFGIYNETFVQIPSSYGQMKVLFKMVNDENYSKGNTYTTNNGGIIEGVSESELTGGYINSTGISGLGIYDTGTSYVADGSTDVFEVELDINKLRTYYGNSNLSYDDIAFGNVNGGDNYPDRFNFNAILVYYSVYDSTGTSVLATNAYGLYILNTSMETTTSGVYGFNDILKVKAGGSTAGTSFSFRVNIKPTSAYNGDVTVSDNSTTAFSESEDFNDVVRNLSAAVETLKSNARFLLDISTTNQQIKSLAASAIDKVDDIEKTVNTIKTTNAINTLVTEKIYNRTYGNLQYNAKSVANQILKNINVTFNSNGDVSVTLSESGLTGDALKLARKINYRIDNKTYCDITKLTALLLALKAE